MNRRIRSSVILILVTLLLLCGCHRRKPDDSSSDDPNPADPQGTALIEEEPGEPEDPQGTALIEEVPADAETLGTLQLLKLGSLQYYLYIPANPVRGMPLIMYLHGSSNRAREAEELLTNEAFTLYLSRGDLGDLRAYAVIPKLDAEHNWNDIAEDLRNLIQKIHDDYGIDLSRVSLTGHSLGGTAAYQLQILMPDVFACIAPMSGSVAASDRNIEALAKTRLWALVGSADTVVDPAGSRDIVSALRKKGAVAYLTEYPDAGHRDIPALALKTSNLLDWLISGGTIEIKD
ncbi:MAG: dienelactone hydrolase family protein [Erysipelotrichaceae bacterium]|nr:dienelactone hydrolase family protein [Erysipelotrichaceae bacterium]